MSPHRKAHEPAVLLVAPATDLPYVAEEVQAIVNTAGLAVRLLQDFAPLTVRQIVQLMAALERLTVQ